MPKFRRIPAVVEAEQFTANGSAPFGGRAVSFDGYRYYVMTAHGEAASVVTDDWIIVEPDGRGFYPCKPDIFQRTYVAVGAPAGGGAEGKAP